MDPESSPAGCCSIRAAITAPSFLTHREISEAASIKLDLPPRALERYLTENIHFDLDEENLSGLELYFEKAAAAGLIPRNKPLEFPKTAARSTAQRSA